GARCIIRTELYDRVALLVSRVEKLARWVEANEAGMPALRRLPSDRRQSAAAGIGCEDRNTVVPAVGDIDETPILGDGDLGSRAVGHEICRKGGYDLQRRHGTAVAIPMVGR